MRLFALSGDGALVKVVITTDETGDDFVLLSAPEVDGLIDDLARLRAAMQPAVLMEHTPVEWEMSPRWSVTRDADQRMLSMRQSGKGWLSFMLSDSEARDLAHALHER